MTYDVDLAFAHMAYAPAGSPSAFAEQRARLLIFSDVLIVCLLRPRARLPLPLQPVLRALSPKKGPSACTPSPAPSLAPSLSWSTMPYMIPRRKG